LAHAAENTYLHAGLLTASEMLRASKAAVKHAVVISDGEIVLDESLALRMLAREMREHGITVSIIQIAGAHPEPSQTTCCNEIATTGGGNYLPDPDPTRVPALVSSEVQRALGRAGRKPKNDVLDPSGPPGDIPPIDRPKPAADPPPPTEGRPTPRRLAVRAVAESPLLQPKPAGEWPTLGEVLPCTGRSDAQVLLVAGDDGTPLLAFGNHGLGRVAAFAVDPGSDAAAEFRTDTAFPGRFAQWVTALLAPVLAPPPADLCQGNELSPSVPTPAEAAALQALAGSPLRLAADWQPPGPRREVVHLGQAAEWAIAGVAALLLLAFVEWWFGRWSPKTGTSG
ncbi:MAG TPA: hypothetical protein VK348_06040, partial [Planctomycetota bacterium]|nr:hypothetical protein [Planctomycetota bacterium]